MVDCAGNLSAFDGIKVVYVIHYFGNVIGLSEYQDVHQVYGS